MLEAVAFLAAWSLLLITLTTKVVNKGRDLEFTLRESNWKLDDMKAVMRRHEENHPDVQSEVERIGAEVSDMAERVMQAEGEVEQLAEENERLRRQLTDRETKESEE